MEEKKSEEARVKKPNVKPPATKTRKVYEKPTARKLTLEQAKLKLMGHAIMGDRGAGEILKMLFDEALPNDHKKSA